MWETLTAILCQIERKSIANDPFKNPLGWSAETRDPASDSQKILSVPVDLAVIGPDEQEPRQVDHTGEDKRQRG